MATAICYLIEVPGRAFNKLMRESHQAPDAHIDFLRKDNEADLWDGMFPDDNTEFLVDLTGPWTLCKIPCAYSALLCDSVDSSIVKQIGNWEQCLRTLLPSVVVIRVDDFLLEPWNARYDYLLIRNSEAVQQFLEWLPSQDSRYWNRLTS